MGGTGIFGALASGYTEAAKARRDQNLALGEHQRDLQIGLLDKLLSDPSTPEEYKGTLLQQRIATTNANQYDKNGILKLPSLDDMRQQLPPVQRPATPGPTSMPPVQLGVPQPPPGMDAGSQGPPSASLPASGIQKPAGSASVPPALPPPSPVTLPSTPLTMPSPPPIAEAGQFHPLTEHEQIARKTQLALDHAKQLIQNGVPAAQAYVAAGLMPKPELHNIPFMGSAINPYTNEVVTGSNSGSKPIGTPQTFVVDGKQVTLQHFLHTDGTDSWAPIQTPGGGEATKPILGTLPTVRSGSSSFDPETGTTHTTSTSQRVLPGAGGQSSSSVSKPSRATRVATVAAGGVGDVGKPGGVVAAMAQEWSDAGVKPPAKYLPYVQKYMADNKLQPGVLSSADAKSRADAGAAIQTLITPTVAMLRDPKIRAQLGPLAGRTSEVEKTIGNLSPEVQRLYGNMKSIYSLAGKLHGWRAIKVADEFEKAFGSLKTNPDSIIAGMESMNDTADAVIKEGYKIHHTGEASKLSPEDEAAAYLAKQRGK